MPSVLRGIRNVRYVANMISSAALADPLITYVNSSGGTTQVEEMSLDATVQLKEGAKAVLRGSCSGIYNSSLGQSSAEVDLKIYVNDTLKTENHDLKTDPTAYVNSSTECSYTIK